MTKPCSIFISYSGSEDSLARTVAEIIGQSLSLEDLGAGPIHRCKAFDIEFSLFGDHNLEDDLGIRFSEYEYELRLTAFESGLRIAAFNDLYRGVTLFLAEKLSAKLSCETLVVENLQREVASFGCR